MRHVSFKFALLCSLVACYKHPITPDAAVGDATSPGSGSGPDASAEVPGIDAPVLFDLAPSTLDARVGAVAPDSASPADAARSSPETGTPDAATEPSLAIDLPVRLDAAVPASLSTGSTTVLSFGSVAPGTSSSALSFTITNMGQATSSVISLSSSNSEFAIQSGMTGDCVSDTTALARGASCSVRVVFTPSGSEVQSGTITFSAVFGGNGSVATNGSGTIPGSLAVFAGVPSGEGSADGTGAAARFTCPSGIAVDGAGNVFVADTLNNTIRKITSDGAVSTLAGTASSIAVWSQCQVLAEMASSAGNADGTGADARFIWPYAVAADGAGNVFVADTWNHTIRKITSDGVVTTLAGGLPGSADGTGPAARFDYPRGVAVDRTGNLFVADTGNHTIRKIAPDGVVTTLAGTAGLVGSVDGTGAAARFNVPQGVAVDGAGNLFVADTDNHTIRKITPDGVVTTLAGTAGLVGSVDGAGTAARFNFPQGLAVDGAGNLFVADTDNHTIRKITPDGVVTTFAGTGGSRGYADGTGADARFWGPFGVAVDGAGNLFVTDTYNHTIRKVTPDGVVTTFAGKASSAGSADGRGPSARFSGPSGMAVDGAGNLFVAETENTTIRKIRPEGVVTTLAGSAGLFESADGTGPDARFWAPSGVAVDGAGNLFVADTGNNTIRKITPDGVVTTFAGTARSRGYADGTGPAARFDLPSGVAVDGAGNLFVADTYNNTIRKITPDGVVTTLAGRAPPSMPQFLGGGGYADGTGTDALFNNPSGVAVDGAGNLFVADTYNNTIRKITPDGVVTTLAGTAGSRGYADGTGAAARFAFPKGVAVDGAGNVFVADTWNNTIRKISPSGVVSTILGVAIPITVGNFTGPLPASLVYPFAVAIDPSSGNLYIALNDAIMVAVFSN